MRSFEKLFAITIVPTTVFLAMLGRQRDLAWLTITALTVLVSITGLLIALRYWPDRSQKYRSDQRRPVLLLRAFRQDVERHYYEEPPPWIQLARTEFLVLALLFILFGVIRTFVDEDARDDALSASLSEPVIVQIFGGSPDYSLEAARWRSRAQRRKQAAELIPSNSITFISTGYVVYFLIASIWWYRRERSYIDALSEKLRSAIGPPVALMSRHVRNRRRSGPTYVRVADSEWREVVADLLADSHLAMVILGESEGLDWELDLLRRHGDHRRIFILSDPKRTRDPSFYRRAFQRFAANGWALPAEEPLPGSVMILDADFRAWLLSDGLADAKSTVAALTPEAPGGHAGVLTQESLDDVRREIQTQWASTPLNPRSLTQRIADRIMGDWEGLMAALLGWLIIGFGPWGIGGLPSATVHTAIGGACMVLPMLVAYQALVEDRSGGEEPISRDYVTFFDVAPIYCACKAIFIFISLLEVLYVGVSPIICLLAAFVFHSYARLAKDIACKYERALSSVRRVIVMEVLQAFGLMLVLGQVQASIILGLAIPLGVMGYIHMILKQRREELHDPSGLLALY